MNLAPKKARLRASLAKLVHVASWLWPWAWASIIPETFFCTFQISVPSKLSAAHT